MGCIITTLYPKILGGDFNQCYDNERTSGIKYPSPFFLDALRDLGFEDFKNLH